MGFYVIYARPGRATPALPPYIAPVPFSQDIAGEPIEAGGLMPWVELYS